MGEGVTIEFAEDYSITCQVDEEELTVEIQENDLLVQCDINPIGGGMDGSVWYDGDGDPDPELGIDRDFYTDNLTGDHYKKISGVWVLRGNIIGPEGPGFTPQEGEKSSSVDAGTLGDMSFTDDYIYFCVKTGVAGEAIWKKSLIFKTN